MNEIDESMKEQEYVNRFLNMIANEYDGGIARNFEKYYIEKDKEINELQNRIEKALDIIENKYKYNVFYKGDNYINIIYFNEDEIEEIINILKGDNK